MSDYKSKHQNYYKHHISTLVLGLALLWMLTGCSITRRIPEGQYLLNKVDMQVEDKRVSSSDLKDYLKQQPNTRILGMRLHLRMHNIPRRTENNNAIGRWLKRVGEAPVLLDTTLIADGAHNVLMYLHSKGYYTATVNSSVSYSGKKANVSYRPGRICDAESSYLNNDLAVRELGWKPTVTLSEGIQRLIARYGA